MIRSMTGFGRAERQTETEKLTIEIKSVNHRYLDLGIKLPRRMNSAEGRLRQEVKSFARRGKLDIFVTCEAFGDNDAVLIYNKKLAEQYVGFSQDMSARFGLQPIKAASELMALPEVFTLVHDEADEERLQELAVETLREAGAAFDRQRCEEGERLKEDILSKLGVIEDSVLRIEERAPQIINEYRSRLYAKVRETLDDPAVDEARIMTEVVIYADRVCVDEETVRLKSHIKSMRQTFESADPDGIGRRLDFIAQEMNREANTILSKSNRVDISEIAIGIKTDIEKIREQVQNIE